ncbi:hypothetical protein BLNAU_3457 [Blattamonas nauphoetae]|uniref:Uncharacterized protein n=1 Tax=Blattamonas nauphoetae TaxID=2049346 RepID=A0ABQ9YD52_9EUKA|nr:hypothetical protein BLNAU_3457 [Blattamonas nauphoetae]
MLEESLRHFIPVDSSIKPDEESFLKFDPNSELSFEDKSAVYRSLVALVKAEYPFDNALQDRTVQFLKSLEPMWDAPLAEKLITDLIPSSPGSPSGFIDSIVILLSSPHSTIVATAFSYLCKITDSTSIEGQSRLVKSDIVSKAFTTIQPHTLSIAGNEEIFDNLIGIIGNCVKLAFPFFLEELGITEAVDQFNHREMIFQKVVIPSSQFVTFLISNRYTLSGDLFTSVVSHLHAIIDIGPFHCPTLEFVLASPIVMALSSCLSIVEDNGCLWNFLTKIHDSLDDWRREGTEVIQSGKQMTQALISEAMEATLEQMMKHDKDGIYSYGIANHCDSISLLLGSNMKRSRW